MSFSKDDLIKIAVAAALNVDLDPALVCSVIEHESSWDPWAVRYESGFYQRYVSPMQGLTDTEKNLRSTSFGLLQIMGQTARELGYDAKWLTGLLDPPDGLMMGCRKLKRCLANNEKVTDGKVDKQATINAALLAYNGGGDATYPTHALAAYSKYEYLNKGVM